MGLNLYIYVLKSLCLRLQPGLSDWTWSCWPILWDVHLVCLLIVPLFHGSQLFCGRLRGCWVLFHHFVIFLLILMCLEGYQCSFKLSFLKLLIVIILNEVFHEFFDEVPPLRDLLSSSLDFRFHGFLDARFSFLP